MKKSTVELFDEEKQQIFSLLMEDFVFFGGKPCHSVVLKLSNLVFQQAEAFKSFKKDMLSFVRIVIAFALLLVAV